MEMQIRSGLLFVTARFYHGDKSMEIDDMLVDTGSGGTLFAVDKVAEIGIAPDPADPIRRITGVGGAEYVFEKRIDKITVGDLVVEEFIVEIGALEYGFAMNGIIGLNFLRKTKAIIDLGDMSLLPTQGST